MSEIVDRAKKAIWESEISVGNCTTPEPLTDDMRKSLERYARAVIFALREPTKEMVAAAANIELRPYEGGEYFDFADAYRAMIDEALK